MEDTVRKNVEVISLIYKSSSFLNFIEDQFKKFVNTKLDGYNCSYRIVGNDPINELIEKLNSSEKYEIYNDNNPNDYYINRVYRCYNYAVNTSKADIVCLVNSDMAFSDGWLDNLLLNHNKNRVTCSRLVESGVLEPGPTAIKKYLGTTPKSFSEYEWLAFSKRVSENKTCLGGLYMPIMIDKSVFISSGGYPEGNIYNDGIGTRNGNVIKSGDDYFVNNILKNIGIEHFTVFNSLVYHMQEGEKRS